MTDSWETIHGPRAVAVMLAQGKHVLQWFDMSSADKKVAIAEAKRAIRQMDPETYQALLEQYKQIHGR